MDKMTKFGATKIIHALIEAEQRLLDYERQCIAKAREAGREPEQHRLDNVGFHKKNIDALFMAGEALTGEV